MGVLYARETPNDNFEPVSTMGVGNASQSQRGLMTAQDKVKLDGINDFVVEQGTSGIWTYRKWNSGIAECWGSSYCSIQQGGTSWGGMYYHETQDFNFPANLFIAFPVCTAIFDTAQLGMICGAKTITKDKVHFYCADAAQTGSSDKYINISAKGKWK